MAIHAFTEYTDACLLRLHTRHYGIPVMTPVLKHMKLQAFSPQAPQAHLMFSICDMIPIQPIVSLNCTRHIHADTHWQYMSSPHEYELNREYLLLRHSHNCVGFTHVSLNLDVQHACLSSYLLNTMVPMHAMRVIMRFMKHDQSSDSQAQYSKLCLRA